jgi:hypothetical protein
MNARRARALQATTMLALPAALVVSLSACSFSASASTTSSIPGTKLAGEVQKQLVKSNPGVTVTGTSCADTPKIMAGGTTGCTATVNGEATKLVVTWTNATGDYSVTTVAA